jgi:hypothetical protein
MTYDLTLNDELRALMLKLIDAARAAAFVPQYSGETTKTGTALRTAEANAFQSAFLRLQLAAEDACPSLLRELVGADNRWFGSAERTPTSGRNPWKVMMFVKYLLNPRFAAERSTCIIAAGTAFNPFGLTNGEILDRLGIRDDETRISLQRAIAA